MSEEKGMCCHCREFATTIVMVAIVGCISFALHSCTGENSMRQKEAVERGLAEYNPTNGNWQWKESK